MYGIDGRADLRGAELTHLEGYQGSAPVRIGNAAAHQLQLDIYGELIDSVYLYNKYGEPISYDDWIALSELVDWLCENWDQADEGIWETRGGRQHFTYSRLMSWVAIERSVRVARRRGLPANLGVWLAERDKITRQIMSAGWNAEPAARSSSTTTPRCSTPRCCSCRWSSSSPPATHAGSRRWTRSAASSSPTASSTATTSRPRRTASRATRAPSRSAPSGTSRRSPGRAGLDDARLAFEKMLTYANHLGLFSRRSAPAASCSGTSRRRSRTWR